VCKPSRAAIAIAPILVSVEAMVYKLFRAFAMQHSGVDCRRCGSSVERRDCLGLAESVCRSCRY
jgi:hypothetical protein